MKNEKVENRSGRMREIKGRGRNKMMLKKEMKKPRNSMKLS